MSRRIKVIQKMIIKIKFFTIIQLFIKCFICIACLVFLYNGLIKLNFVENAINYIITKLDWKNYGIWVFHLIGTILGFIWQIVYQYKQASRKKNTIQIIDKNE